MFLGKSLLVVLLQKFTLAWRAQAVIWGDTARNAIPVHRCSQDFWLGVGQTKNLMQWSHQKFSKEEFLWDKDIVEWKIRSRGLVWHLTESFRKGEGLNQKLQMKISTWETCASKLVYSNVSQTGIWGRSPSRWAIFRNFFEKKAILMPLDHVSDVFRTIERSRLSTFESQLKKIKLFQFFFYL